MKPERPEVLAPPSEVSRRTALQLLAASAALAAAPGCDRKPYRRIVSMAETPEYQHPGEPLDYASTWTEGQVPYGMMIRTLDGRPVKVEGLPGHPLNRGASTAAMQAAILSLYDPGRPRFPMRGGSRVTWAEVDEQVGEALRAARSVVLITRATLGPAERSLVKRFLAACPVARHFVHETVHDGPRREAWRTAYGRDGALRPCLERAKVILSVDADFLGTDGAVLEAIAGFAANRVVGEGARGAESLSRLYVAESAMTVTGSNADHRIPLRPSASLALVEGLRAALAGDRGALDRLAAQEGLDAKVLEGLAQDLAARRGEALVLAGSHLPPAVHAAVCLLNDEIGAPGATLEWSDAAPALAVDAPEAISAALAGGVDVLLLLGVNPVYDWPGGGFEELLSGAGLSVGHGLFADETVGACALSLPSSHNLESWNDAQALAGVRSLCQPVIAPLHDARQEAESLLVWTKLLAPGDAGLAALADWHDYVRAEWLGGVLAGAADARLAWEDALRQGVVGAPERAAVPPLRRSEAEELARGPLERTEGGLELVLLPHHALFDGRFAHSGWLQEFPEPVSKLVWDNALALGPATAARLALAEGDLVEVRAEGRAVTLPVLVQPGVARGVAVATLGHGRRALGAAREGGGSNAAPLLGRGAAPRFRPEVQISCAGGSRRLVRVQKTFDMHGRPIVLHGTRADYERDPRFVRERLHAPAHAQLHGEYDYSLGHKWALAVDLGACVGCGACMIACQAENNVPVVGKEECALGREMHWLRLDRYEGGDPENPHVYQQLMACQHCDNAPCESVCPVNATAHSPEGLNEQIYNRCVGTRYCANNCPYKVRRYNFYHYVKRNLSDALQELAFNPRVTVRSRGVMEKCTFCVQRINEVKFRLKTAGTESIPDGAIRPACAQACPAGAIVFGDVNDPESKVRAAGASPLAYRVLEELNVRPAVFYLARVTNPHPDAAAAAPPAGHGGPR
ncbi:MAG: 4Fe-4S dicluster domain-containing protein [Planctomycetes bacterium]|nr:4Fe-4S dicluster domain-containing protein [Planctomycetota bacterium]